MVLSVQRQLELSELLQQVYVLHEGLFLQQENGGRLDWMID